jgi:hypothetical protein
VGRGVLLPEILKNKSPGIFTLKKVTVLTFQNLYHIDWREVSLLSWPLIRSNSRSSYQNSENSAC